jgi:hypothetical protein
MPVWATMTLEQAGQRVTAPRIRVARRVSVTSPTNAPAGMPAPLPATRPERIDAATGVALETLAPVSELMQISESD